MNSTKKQTVEENNGNLVFVCLTYKTFIIGNCNVEYRIRTTDHICRRCTFSAGRCLVITCITIMQQCIL